MFDRNELKRRTLSLALVLCASVVMAACSSMNEKSEAPERQSKYAEIIAESESAFMDRDVEGAIARLDEDYILYDVTDDGAIERLRGQEQVRQALGQFFQSDVWVDSQVDRFGLIENILVQIEYDTYKTEDGGTKTVPTLVVFEHRNGKRWREWRFRPEDR